MERDKDDDTGVDKTLVAAFIDMTVEERLLANDNAARAILELRYAYRQQQTDSSGPRGDS